MITVATDCSGIEAPLMALNNLKIQYDHIFSSEIDKNCINFIETNFKPRKIYTDIKGRDNSIYSGTPLDLYIAGFPCQTFSSLGRGQGLKDVTKGTIFFNVYDFIETNRPTVFVLENVRTLKTHNKGETFKTIMGMLEQLTEYNLYVDILNTSDFGIPHSRNRLFIVGIKDERPFQFPDIKKVPRELEQYIDPNIREPGPGILQRHSILMSEIVNKYTELDFYNNIYGNMWILNLNVSSIKWFRRGKQGICPCLVTSCKYYIPRYDRYLVPLEALKLQGINVDEYKFEGRYTDSQLYKFAGNTISIIVIQSILENIFGR